MAGLAVEMLREEGDGGRPAGTNEAEGRHGLHLHTAATAGIREFATPRHGTRLRCCDGDGGPELEDFSAASEVYTLTHAHASSPLEGSPVAGTGPAGKHTVTPTRRHVVAIRTTRARTRLSPHRVAADEPGPVRQRPGRRAEAKPRARRGGWRGRANRFAAAVVAGRAAPSTSRRPDPFGARHLYKAQAI
jgi:hypothetical protein